MKRRSAGEKCSKTEILMRIFSQDALLRIFKTDPTMLGPNNAWARILRHYKIK